MSFDKIKREYPKTKKHSEQNRQGAKLWDFLIKSKTEYKKPKKT